MQPYILTYSCCFVTQVTITTTSTFRHACYTPVANFTAVVPFPHWHTQTPVVCLQWRLRLFSIISIFGRITNRRVILFTLHAPLWTLLFALISRPPLYTYFITCPIVCNTFTIFPIMWTIYAFLAVSYIVASFTVVTNAAFLQVKLLSGHFSQWIPPLIAFLYESERQSTPQPKSLSYVLSQLKRMYWQCHTLVFTCIRDALRWTGTILSCCRTGKPPVWR